MSPTPVRVGVVTGSHPYDVLALDRMLRSIPGIEYVVFPLEEFAVDWGGLRASLDVVVFYNMHIEEPDSSPLGTLTRTALESLGRADQGILVLHHGILAFPGWDLWNELTGIGNRSFSSHKNVRFRVRVATDHPVTAGLSDFDLGDETYVMDSAGADSVHLLAVDDERSMATIGWARTFRDSRVLCLQSGHDHEALDDASFRHVFGQGVVWLAGRN